MQRTLACLAILVAGSLVGCGKDRHKEPSTVTYETQPRGRSTPTRVAKTEPPAEPAMTPASGSTRMTPASGTRTSPPPVGVEPGPELAVGSRGPVILQHEAANELAHAICERQAACEESTAADCERTVQVQSKAALAGCDNGLSRTELYVCLTALSEKACGAGPSTLSECSASSLCLP